ncbi:GNAT family N-acetyltransferase [Glaciihabitans tibetensis]
MLEEISRRSGSRASEWSMCRSNSSQRLTPTASATSYELSPDGAHALIRSVAVAPTRRAAGAGSRLAMWAMAHAARSGAEQAWLFSRCTAKSRGHATSLICLMDVQAGRQTARELPTSSVRPRKGSVRVAGR